MTSHRKRDGKCYHLIVQRGSQNQKGVLLTCPKFHVKSNMWKISPSFRSYIYLFLELKIILSYVLSKVVLSSMKDTKKRKASPLLSWNSQMNKNNRCDEVCTRTVKWCSHSTAERKPDFLKEFGKPSQRGNFRWYLKAEEEFIQERRMWEGYFRQREQHESDSPWSLTNSKHSTNIW